MQVKSDSNWFTTVECATTDDEPLKGIGGIALEALPPLCLESRPASCVPLLTRALINLVQQTRSSPVATRASRVSQGDDIRQWLQRVFLRDNEIPMASGAMSSHFA